MNKPLATILFLFAFAALRGQSNQLIIVENTDTIGFHSRSIGLVFTTEVNQELCNKIQRQLGYPKYYTRLKWSLDDYEFSKPDAHFSLDGLYKTNTDEKSLTAYSLSEEGLNRSSIIELQNNVKIASNRYLLADAVQVGGNTVGMILVADAPVTGVMVSGISNIVGYFIRLSGHIVLGR